MCQDPQETHQVKEQIPAHLLEGQSQLLTCFAELGKLLTPMSGVLTWAERGIGYLAHLQSLGKRPPAQEAPKDEHTEVCFLTDKRMAFLAIAFWFPEA